ncbi:MAG: Maf family protein [Gammaproteobacteria bacterium]|nr:Maf family protein [Gammaproteobacteria bacterium]
MTMLILASSSPYRSRLFEKLGLPFQRVNPDVDESPLAGETPLQLVARLAQLKARAVAASHSTAVIVSSDQVAVCADDVLGKPLSEPRARAQLARLSGRYVTFLTSLCVLNSASGNRQLEVVTTPVEFRELTELEIANYVAREQPLDCAGAFKSEGLGIALFNSIGGNDPNALVGVPLISLCRMLRAEGIDVLG